MEKQQLLKYLSMVIDLEKNKYIQEQTISKLENEINQLAISQEINHRVANESDMT